MRPLAYLAAVPLLLSVPLGQSTASLPQTESTAAMKTQTYKGTLVDASCAMQSGPSSAAQKSAQATSESAPRSERGSADRQETGGQAGACAVTANTKEFALRLDDGRTVRFDSVGNERAQEAIRNKKKWNEAVAAGKPIQAKVSAVLTGDKLTVMSIQ